MSEDKAALEREAIAWVIRTRDPAFADWEGFTAWLERSEANASLYDSLSLADEQIAEQVPPATRFLFRSRRAAGAGGPAAR